jgi:hypothetical protein
MRNNEAFMDVVCRRRSKLVPNSAEKRLLVGINTPLGCGGQDLFDLVGQSAAAVINRRHHRLRQGKPNNT